ARPAPVGGLRAREFRGRHAVRGVRPEDPLLVTALSSDAEELARRRYLESTPRRRFFRFWGEFIRRRPLGAFGLLLMIVMILSAIFADPIAPYDPSALSFKALLAPRSPDHLMGTHNFGRDVFSRLVFGSRTALLLGFRASIVGCTPALALRLILAVRRRA